MVTAGTLSLVVLVATGLLWGLTGYAINKVERVAAFRGLDDRPPQSDGVNILLVGSDRRAGLSPQMRKKLHVGKAAGRRSDTMILAHISADHNRATLVSLPRDWRVTIPAHQTADGERVAAQEEKLNAAYSLGGANLAVATVEKNTGIHIDHYVEVSFLGFVKVVDAIGGVDVCMPQPVNDPASGLTLPKGKSHLNGVQSLKYVRARKTLGDGSDLGRMQRQQAFLGSMMQQALSTGTLLNPFKFTDFLNASLAAVTVDEEFSPDDLRRLALVLRDLDPGRVTFLTVPIADASLSMEQPGLAADKEKAGRLFERIREDEPIGKPERASSSKSGGKDRDGRGGPKVTIPPSRISIEVYNDTNIAGLGSRATRDLREIGLLIENPPGNADPPNSAEQTIIQYGPDRGDSARTLAAALPDAQMREIPALGDDIQVVVGSSYDGAHDVEVRASSDSDSSGGLDTRSAAQKPCA